MVKTDMKPTKDDIVIYLLIRALLKSIEVAEPDSTLDDRKEMVDGLIGLAASESGLPNPMVVLEKAEIGRRIELAMDRLRIVEPLRLIPGGRS